MMMMLITEDGGQARLLLPNIKVAVMWWRWVTSLSAPDGFEGGFSPFKFHQVAYFSARLLATDFTIPPGYRRNRK